MGLLAIRLAPDSLEYYVTRGFAHDKSSHFDDALRDYNHVIQKDDKHEQALVNRAFLYSRALHLPAKSLEDWSTLVEFYPSGRNFAGRSWANMEVGDMNAALSDIDKALSLYPKSELYLCRKGYYLGLVNQIKRSNKYFDKALKLNSRNPLVYKYRGIVRLRNGMSSEGCEDLRKAKALGLDVPELSSCQ